MTAAISPPHAEDGRAELLKQLRRQMADVSGKVGASRRGQTTVPDLSAPTPDPNGLLPVPKSLSELLPAGLPRGVVATLSGARSLPLGMAAAVTAGGGHVAIVGHPDAGLLAAVEMGADLSRLAVIPDPGTDPIEVAAVLMDGMDLVVLGLNGRSVPPSRARAVTARAQHKGCTLLATDGDWPGASLRLEARVRGYEMTVGAVPGCGRIGRVQVALRGTGRGARSRSMAG